MYDSDKVYEVDIIKIINNNKVLVSSNILAIYNDSTNKFIIEGSRAWNSLFELFFSNCKFEKEEEDRLWKNINKDNIDYNYYKDNTIFIDKNSIKEFSLNKKRK